MDQPDWNFGPQYKKCTLGRISSVEKVWPLFENNCFSLCDFSPFKTKFPFPIQFSYF